MNKTDRFTREKKTGLPQKKIEISVVCITKKGTPQESVRVGYTLAEPKEARFHCTQLKLPSTPSQSKMKRKPGLPAGPKSRPYAEKRRGAIQILPQCLLTSFRPSLVKIEQARRVRVLLVLSGLQNPVQVGFV